jgi:hypothetical protein
MPVIQDDSLRDHARLVRSSHDAHTEAVRELSEARAASRDLLSADPWMDLPAEVADAKAEYEASLGVELRFLTYTLTHNGELDDAIDTDQPLPEDPVQLTRAVTVSSSHGAVIVLEQWLAEALPS